MTDTGPDATIPQYVLRQGLAATEVPQDLLDKFDELKAKAISAEKAGWVKRERPLLASSFEPPPVNVYIGIGNSDDKLSQAEWAEFVADVKALLDNNSVVRGEWFSASDSMFQNACWWVEVTNVVGLQAGLQDLAILFRQDSIAWTVMQETSFIRPESLLPLD